MEQNKENQIRIEELAKINAKNESSIKMQKSSKSDDISVKQLMMKREAEANALKGTQNIAVKSDDKDSEEVLFDAEEHEKKEEKKEGGFIKKNFEVVDHLPELNSGSSKVHAYNSEKDEINDLSLSVNDSDKDRPELDDELRPLPSPSPVFDKQQPNINELCKSIAQIKNEKKKDKPHRQKFEKSTSDKLQKPAYSFLGLGGGGLSKPK